MAAGYEFPSQDQVRAFGAANQGGNPGQILTLGTPLVAPGLPAQRLSFRQRLAILIAGADAGSVLFPPQQPLQPIAQEPERGVVGRVWDFPPGYNLRVTPRSGWAINFQTLKALADGYDVLRALIERVKDKVCTKPWNFLPRDKTQAQDERCEQLESFFAYPDKENTWQDWSRMLLEQVIVYDAPAIYIRPTRGGDVFSLEVMDGSMIAPKIWAPGKTPPFDAGPAYQQVIQSGLPAVDYIKPVPKGFPMPRDPDGNPMPELLYKPRNPRVDSVYGFGPVEQMIVTVNIAIRREQSLLSFYTHGSRPDTVFTTPATWTSKEVADFKVWWDSVLEGNLENRRGTMFVPDGAKPFDMKAGLLTDETDQWLIRIMCFFLGLNPMPFVKQMNRGQEQTHHEEAVQEGLMPWQAYITDMINHLVRLKWGWADLEFKFDEDDPVDPVDQSKIDASDVQAGIYHPDEIRAKRGDDAMPEDMRDQMAMANYRNAPNASVLPEAMQQAQNEHALALAAARPAPAAPGKPEPTKQEKLEEIAALGKALQSPPAHINVESPVVNIQPPKVDVHAAPVNVTLPEIKQADVFVDVGATNVKVDVPRGTSGPVTKTIRAERGPDGKLRGEIIKTETVRIE